MLNMIIFLWQESKKTNSEYSAYLATMPPNFDSFPEMFDAEDDLWIKDTPVERKVNENRAISKTQFE